MTKNEIKILVLIGILSFATICSAHEFKKLKQETVTQHKVAYRFSNAEIERINHATDLVKKYWDSSNGAEAIYNLFSKNYKNELKRTKKIDNARDYIEYMYPPEFSWFSQTYIKARIEENMIVKITVIAEWFQEGYEGIDIFTFVIIKEGNDWKIENIKRWEEKQG